MVIEINILLLCTQIGSTEPGVLGALGSLCVDLAEEATGYRGIRQDPGTRGSYKLRAGDGQVALVA